MSLDISVQLPLFLFKGVRKGTKCTYLVVSVLEGPSLHYIWAYLLSQNDNICSFYLVFYSVQNGNYCIKYS